MSKTGKLIKKFIHDYGDQDAMFKDELFTILNSYAEQVAKEHAKAGYEVGVLDAFTAEGLGADLNIDIAFEEWYNEWIKPQSDNTKP